MGCLPQLSALVSGSEFSTICVLRNQRGIVGYIPVTHHLVINQFLTPNVATYGGFPTWGYPQFSSMVFSDVPLETLQLLGIPH